MLSKYTVYQLSALILPTQITGSTVAASNSPVTRLTVKSLVCNYTFFSRLWMLVWCCMLFIVLASASSLAVADTRVDLNNAPASLLAQSLPGIGPAKAKAIVDYRSRNGAFESLEALVDVKGIGPKTLERIRSLLVIEKMVSSSPLSNPVSSVSSEARTRQAVRAVVNNAKKDAMKKTFE